MHATIRAAIVATMVIGMASLVLYTKTPQALAIILYIIVMIPLWAIDNLGIDIGADRNGFFLPTPAGYAVAAAIFWCGTFVLIRAMWPAKPFDERCGKQPPNKSLERTRER